MPNFGLTTRDLTQKSCQNEIRSKGNSITV
jgi:hypothetical protein